jgi:hypothetical protein
MNRTVLASALAFASTASVFAAGNSATTAANAKVKIRKAITLTKTADLDFGGIVISAAGTAADTAVLSPANVLTAPGTNGTIVGTFNTTAPAAFNVTGTKSATYAVTLPAAPITLVGPGGGVTVGTFTSTSGSGTNTLSAAAGTDTLSVGGTLTVPQTTVDGDYTGSFSVTVAYN